MIKPLPPELTAMLTGSLTAAKNGMLRRHALRSVDTLLKLTGAPTHHEAYTETASALISAMLPMPFSMAWRRHNGLAW